MPKFRFAKRKPNYFEDPTISKRNGKFFLISICEFSKNFEFPLVQEKGGNVEFRFVKYGLSVSILKKTYPR